MQQAGLADAHVPNDDVLEDVAVVVGPRCHVGLLSSNVQLHK